MGTYNYLFSLEAQHKSSILFVVTIAVTKHMPRICFVDVKFAKNGLCWPQREKVDCRSENPPMFSYQNNNLTLDCLVFLRLFFLSDL